MGTTTVANIPLRKSLSADQLIWTVCHIFKNIPDPRTFKLPVSLSFSDVLMSGLAVFGLKFPSLLQYDQGRQILDHNLKTLYHVKRFVSDSYLRERLDELDPKYIRPAFLKIFTKLQRGKCLEAFEYFDGHYLLALDGTGHFSSSNVSCEQCCKKQHKNGSITYYHQMLGASIVHPDHSSVIPLCPEPIINGDGSRKNDCERNAATRFIDHFRKEHPHLKVIVLGDGIASNAPYIQLLEERRMKYLLAAKPGDHRFLFETVDASEETAYHEFTDEKGFLHQFRYLNGVALNKSHPEVLINFMEYSQTDSKGKETRFSWVTNIKIKESNLVMLMRGGRARWKVENETFNTLKNLGYNFEHNYGHGKKYLSTILCLLMMLAFLIDQTQEIGCRLFRAIRQTGRSYRWLWETIRVLFQFVLFSSWEELYRKIAQKVHLEDTS